ncbi:MAG: tetratricopeptide repeat protein [Pirellulales bacterium]|nr:tetratricopeptide repeat protein [Pirellulales bacterium]
MHRRAPSSVSDLVFGRWPERPSSGRLLLSAISLPCTADLFWTTRDSYRQALSCRPKFAPAHNKLGLAYQAQGQYQEAIRQYQHAIRLSPDYLDAYKNLTFTYAQLHYPADAVATAQKALDIARRRGKHNLADQIESWLKTHQAPHPSSPSVDPTKVPKGR